MLKGCRDPDGFGLLDDIESLIGLGFVACQRYLTRDLRMDEVHEARSSRCGTNHRSGLTVAEILTKPLIIANASG